RVPPGPQGTSCLARRSWIWAWAVLAYGCLLLRSELVQNNHPAPAMPDRLDNRVIWKTGVGRGAAIVDGPFGPWPPTRSGSREAVRVKKGARQKCSDDSGFYLLGVGRAERCVIPGP